MVRQGFETAQENKERVKRLSMYTLTTLMQVGLLSTSDSTCLPKKTSVGPERD